MASDKRPPITLVCTETGDHNYVTTKNKTNTPDRLELMKYSCLLYTSDAADE